MLSIQSAYSGQAIVFEGDERFLISCYSEEKYQLNNREIATWLRSHGELREYSSENILGIRSSLSLYVNRRKALQLSLFAIDADLNSSLRETSIKLLEPLLNQEEIHTWLEDALCIKELPDSSVKISKDVLDHAKSGGFLLSFEILKFVVENQNNIFNLSSAWGQLEASGFFGRSHTDIVEKVIGTGFFKSLVKQGAEVDTPKLALLSSLITKPVLDKDIINRIRAIDFEYTSIVSEIGLESATNGIEELHLWDNALALTIDGRISLTCGDPTNHAFPTLEGNQSNPKTNLFASVKGIDGHVEVPMGMLNHMEFLYNKEGTKKSVNNETQEKNTPSLTTNSRVKNALVQVNRWRNQNTVEACEMLDSFSSFLVKRND
ncbi:MAG: hypothetical protein ABW092_04025 [Candidatus Thiodiazotropha sp.]